MDLRALPKRAKPSRFIHRHAAKKRDPVVDRAVGDGEGWRLPQASSCNVNLFTDRFARYDEFDASVLLPSGGALI